VLNREVTIPEKKQETDKQPPKRWFLLVSAVPWLLIVTGYVEAVLASVVLGHWPRPSLDDPKQLATAPLHLIYQLLFIGLLPAFFWLIFMTISHRKALRAPSFYPFGWGIFLSGALILHFLTSADPGNVWYWLAD
jgi:hypothetical protein